MKKLNALKNKLSSLKEDERTFHKLICIARDLDMEVGKEICDCINAKEVALKGSKEDIKAYAKYATEKLKDSISMTLLFRTIVSKLIEGVITIDKQNVANGGVPVSPILLEGRVEIKDIDEAK